MRKALLLPLVLLLALAPLAADTYELILTAVKYGAVPGSMPDPTVELKLLNPANAYIGADAEIPEAARGEARKAFSWQAAGNVFGACALTFTAGPLARKYYVGEGGSPVQIPSAEATALPFALTFHKSPTKVGNFAVPWGGTPRQSPADFTVGGYVFSYSDSTDPDDLSALSLARTVGEDHKDNTGAASAAITYDMSANSAVSKLESGNPVGAGDADYPAVCNHWNRSGDVWVRLGIKESEGSIVYEADNSPVADGHYESAVTVEITAT